MSNVPFFAAGQVGVMCWVMCQSLKYIRYMVIEIWTSVVFADVAAILFESGVKIGLRASKYPY